MNIKTILVDDEPLARDRLRDLLGEHGDIDIIGEAASGAEAKQFISHGGVDLLLLDVQMPRLTGLKLAQLLADEPLPLVVFVTAHDGFAVEAFDTRAVDYLLKPVRPERLARALERVRDQLAAMRETPGEKPLPAAGTPPRPTLSHLMARAGERVVFIKAGQIDWIESAGNYVVVSAGAERHIIRETLATLEQELAPKDFVRLNRSVIVNLRMIAALNAKGAGEYCATLTDGKQVNVTVSLRELEARLRFA